jgi:HAD superfamily hydrolase (TIGR01509 family)
MRALLERKCWVFDLDGTLTLAVHDFDAIRDELGLPPGRPILESLAHLSEAEQAPLRRRLADIERDIAARSTLAEGALELLEHLASEDARLGILTRNTRENALITLEAVGLLPYFDEAAVLGRDEAPPKPDPAGVRVHLERWATPGPAAVMVGDFEFDLRAGRAAGAATVYVDPSGAFPHRAWADVSVTRLDALLAA